MTLLCASCKRRRVSSDSTALAFSMIMLAMICKLLTTRCSNSSSNISFWRIKSSFSFSSVRFSVMSSMPSRIVECEPLLIEDFTGIQERRAPSDSREIMLHFIVFHGSSLGNDFSKQQTKLRNIPLAIAEVIQKLALSGIGIDFERQIERMACSNDLKILIEHNERFSNRIDNSVRKYPGILDLGELFSKHVTTLAGRESAELSVSCVPNPLLKIVEPIPIMPGGRHISTVPAIQNSPLFDVACLGSGALPRF